MDTRATNVSITMSAGIITFQLDMSDFDKGNANKLILHAYS